MNKPRFFKVYSITKSSVWETEMHVRVVWLTLLDLADERGYVEASMAGLARDANLVPGDREKSRELCEAAITVLEAPDPDSKNPDNEGRRLKPVKGGWFIFNYRAYWERGSSTERVKAHRARVKANVETDVTTETRPFPFSSSREELKGKGKDALQALQALHRVSLVSELEAGELVQRIRGLAERHGDNGVLAVKKEKVQEELGPDVFRVYDALGGSQRFLAASGKDYSFLVAGFRKSLNEVRAAADGE
jgi:hypothetical protein